MLDKNKMQNYNDFIHDLETQSCTAFLQHNL